MDGLVFVYELDERQMGTPHTVTALRDDSPVGRIEWSRATGIIRDIRVPIEARRQGVATALLAEARRVAQETRGIKAPRHNPDRTDDGEAWARSLSERLPRRAIKD